MPLTCPNRDGVIGTGGCSFCGEQGVDFGFTDKWSSVKQQLATNREAIKRKYKVKKFIAYFQNYTNTYMAFSEFKNIIEAVCEEDVVEIAISTRPDCIRSDYLDFLQEVAIKYNKNISVELGLQTVNYRTLKAINRGHSLAEFVDAVLACSNRGFSTCAHLILNLPDDEEIDIIESAKLISALRVAQVKLHSLYIVKNTPMEQAYNKGQLNLIPLEEYIKRVVTFLEYLHPEIAVQRLVGRAPETKTVFANWGTSAWKINKMIELAMFQQDAWQGKRCTYLNGSAIQF